MGVRLLESRSGGYRIPGVDGRGPAGGDGRGPAGGDGRGPGGGGRTWPGRQARDAPPSEAYGRLRTSSGTSLRYGSALTEGRGYGGGGIMPFNARPSDSSVSESIPDSVRASGRLGLPLGRDVFR